MAGEGPFPDVTQLLAAAETGWSQLSEADWREVFGSHPRIGEKGGDAPAASEREQSRASSSSPATLSALADDNRAYETRFGHVFLIAAAGRSGEEILAELRRRMSNDSATEFETAKEELRKISRMRIQKMLEP